MEHGTREPARRAAEARERARTAGVRAAELRARLAGVTSVSDIVATAREAYASSQVAAARAAELAQEGYAHAAAAERSAAQLHDTFADLLEARARAEPGQSEQLQAKARDHRRDAARHRDLALIDDAHGEPAQE